MAASEAGDVRAMIEVDSAPFLLVMVSAAVAAITAAVLPRSIAPSVVVELLPKPRSH